MLKKIKPVDELKKKMNTDELEDWIATNIEHAQRNNERRCEMGIDAKLPKELETKLNAGGYKFRIAGVSNYLKLIIWW